MIVCTESVCRCGTCRLPKNSPHASAHMRIRIPANTLQVGQTYQLTRYVEDEDATVPEPVTERFEWSRETALAMSDAAASRGDMEACLGWLDVGVLSRKRVTSFPA